MDALFVCKINHSFKRQTKAEVGSGLSLSVTLLSNGINSTNLESHVVEVESVTGENSLEKKIIRHRPKHVVIQALWANIAELKTLKNKYQKIRFAVHIHSHIPFLAVETNAISQIKEYLENGIEVIVNSYPAYEAMRVIDENVVYLPNVYSSQMFRLQMKQDSDFINVGCFGSVRPMKNNLLQAIAAIQFSREINKKLRFHINATRMEGGGAPAFTNIMRLFADDKDGELIPHPWYNHNDFIKALSDIDIGMQVSLSETFNIVTADMVAAAVPVVVSKEISWVNPYCIAPDDSLNGIVEAMHRVYKFDQVVHDNQARLEEYSSKALGMWCEWLKR